MSEGPAPAPHSPRRILFLILLGHTLLALAYNLATPVGEGPDEPSHFEYVHYLRRHRALPVVPEAGQPPMTQAKHPPLYYLSAALATAWADLSTLGFVANPYLPRRFDFDAPGSTLAHVHFEHEQFPYRHAEGFLAARLMRVLSLLAGLVVIVATYGIARRTWPADPHLAWGAAAVVAFLPGFVFSGAVFNNDSLAAAWAALALWASVRIAQGKVRGRDLAAAGLVLGLGLITKLTTLAAFGVVGAAILIHAWRNGRQRLRGPGEVESGLGSGGLGDPPGRPYTFGRLSGMSRFLVRGAGQVGDAPGRPNTFGRLSGMSRFLVRGAGQVGDAAGRPYSFGRLSDTGRFLLRAAWQVGVPVLVVAGWWLLRNMRLYGAGDPLALRRWAERVPESTTPAAISGHWGLYFRIQSESFWGRFGWLTVPMPEGVYLFLDGLALLAGLGLVLMVLRPRRPLMADTRWALSLCALAILLFYLSIVRLGHQFGLIAAQGRYLYVVLPAIGLFLVTGLARLVPGRWEPRFMAGLALGMAALALGALLAVLRPAFALPEPLADAAIAAIPARVDADFDGRLRLVGYDPAPALPAGSPPGLTLYWTALPENRRPPFPPAETPATRLQLRRVDAAGATLAEIERAPFAGRFPPVAWLPGAVYSETLALPASAGPDRSAAITPERWELRLRDPVGDDESWPLRASGAGASDWLRLPIESGDGPAP